MGARTDSAEKRLARKVYQKLSERVGRWNAEDADATLGMGDTWIAGNKHGPIRNIASHLFGLLSATVGKYWKELEENDGIHAAEKTIGPTGNRRIPLYKGSRAGRQVALRRD